jgi:hypothetical protein
MGLLDDAIREHLELKRLRGADPGEVAREQREALDSVPRDASGEQDGYASAAAVSDGARGDAGEQDISKDTAQAGDGLGLPQPAHDADFSHVGQETAEFDMRTVLGEEQDASGNGGAGGDPTPESAGIGGDAQVGERPEEDSLEWEVPADAPDTQSSGAGSHGHTTGDDAPAGETVEGHPASEGTAEDVLEETPDFLRDTPEQERLWFEQRPPRDFDFDK